MLLLLLVLGYIRIGLCMCACDFGLYFSPLIPVAGYYWNNTQYIYNAAFLLSVLVLLVSQSACLSDYCTGSMQLGWKIKPPTHNPILYSSASILNYIDKLSPALATL